MLLAFCQNFDSSNFPEMWLATLSLQLQLQEPKRATNYRNLPFEISAWLVLYWKCANMISLDSLSSVLNALLSFLLHPCTRE